jgi:hypothetical protein
MLDVPDVQNVLVVDPLDTVGRRTGDFHHDEGTFPGGGELVSSMRRKTRSPTLKDRSRTLRSW